MICDGHGLNYGWVYSFPYNGNCETCGSPHQAEKLYGIYQGDLDGRHIFELVSQFSCLGCHLVVERTYHWCGGIDITKELHEMKFGSKQ